MCGITVNYTSFGQCMLFLGCLRGCVESCGDELEIEHDEEVLYQKSFILSDVNHVVIRFFRALRGVSCAAFVALQLGCIRIKPSNSNDRLLYIISLIGFCCISVSGGLDDVLCIYRSITMNNYEQIIDKKSGGDATHFKPNKRFYIAWKVMRFFMNIMQVAGLLITSNWLLYRISQNILLHRISQNIPRWIITGVVGNVFNNLVPNAFTAALANCNVFWGPGLLVGGFLVDNNRARVAVLL